MGQIICFCKCGICFNKPSLQKLRSVLQHSLPSHPHLHPCSLGSHSVGTSQVFWMITKDTAVTTCGLMCMGLMSIEKPTKIFLFSVQTLVILYFSITPRFLLFSLLLLQDCYFLSQFKMKHRFNVTFQYKKRWDKENPILPQLLQSLRKIIGAKICSVVMQCSKNKWAFTWRQESKKTCSWSWEF